MSTPGVTVIIPAYNAAGCVGRAIESALAQTAPPQEILVVDDGSRDETAAVASRYPAPVRVIRKANGGPASARNLGARQARGEWLALLDADDTWRPQKLEKQLRHSADPEVGIIHCVGPDRARDSGPVTFDLLWEQNRIANSTVLVRRKAFEAVGGLDEDRALIGVEDYNLWLRITAAGWKVADCTESLWDYNPEPGSLSTHFDRFARAEIANAERVAALLGLPRERLKAKRAAICQQYGRDLLWKRDLASARRWLLRGMLELPTPARLGWWMLSLLPRTVLDSYRAARFSR